MSRYYDSDCVGCETCVGCGRSGDYEVIRCDECDDVVEEGEVNMLGRKELCPVCYAKATISNEEVVECLNIFLDELTEDDAEDLKWSLLVAIDKFKE